MSFITKKKEEKIFHDLLLLKSGPSSQNGAWVWGSDRRVRPGAKVRCLETALYYPLRRIDAWAPVSLQAWMEQVMMETTFPQEQPLCHLHANAAQLPECFLEQALVLT